MYSIVTSDDFCRALTSDKYANWTREGAEALYDYLEEWYGPIDHLNNHGIEFDVVGIRCEFHEYDSAIEALKEYGTETDMKAIGSLSPEVAEVVALRWLGEQTNIIEVDNGHVIVHRF